MATIMPAVEEDLGGLWLYGWAFSAFYLGTMIGVVAGGRGADRVRPVVPLAAGVAVFLAGLVAAGAAPSMGVLVAGRFLQGLGAGVVPAVAYVSVGRGFPAALRPSVFAVMSTAWVLPSLVSPVAASLVAEAVGWRWVFLGLVPVTVVVALVGGRAVSRLGAPPRDGLRRPPVLWVLAMAAGAAAVLGGLGAAELVVGIPVALLGVVVALPAYRALTPEGTLRASEGLPAAVLTRGVLTFAFFSAQAFVSLAMTSVGSTTRWAGVVLGVASLLWTVGSWIQARLYERLGPTGLVRAGGTSIAAGSVGMALCVASGAPPGAWLAAGAVAGLGMGLAYAPISVVTLSHAEPGREGAATSAMQLSDISGTSLGTGVAGVIVSVGDRLGATAAAPLVGVFGMSTTAALCVALLATQVRRPVQRDGRPATRPSLR